MSDTSTKHTDTERGPEPIMLGGDDVSTFCDSCASMLSAGIQADEAVFMLLDGLEPGAFRSVCQRVWEGLAAGSGMARSMRDAGGFPDYALALTEIGERSGRLEKTLRTLAVYYDEEERLFGRLRSSIGYPAALLCVMSAILAFTVAGILPVFLSVYEQLAGGVASSSFISVNLAIGVGWVALAVVLVASIAAVAAALAVRSPRGRERIMHALERIPLTRDAMYRLALCRFTSALSSRIAAGEDTDVAMAAAADSVDHAGLRERVDRAHDAMTDPARALSLSQAITEFEVLDPVHARLLAIGSRTGRMDAALDELSQTFFDDAVTSLDATVDAVEPALAALLTIAVGATLISVMLPIIGMMGAIG